MTQQMYSLVARSNAADVELLQSPKANVLRNCGRVLAQDTAADTDLVLIDSKGLAVAYYDVWSSQWQAPA